MNISIVIPVYNAENSILKVLESVKKQTYKDFEIIVVNDGSTDSSEELINSFIQVNPSIEFTYISQINKGVSAARNKGIYKSKGGLIAFLDSDDQWLPNKLERQIQVLKENPQIDLLGTNRNNECFNDFWFKEIGLLTKINTKELLYKMFFFTSTVILKKEILEVVGLFDEKQSYCEDGNLFIRISEKFNCYFLNESLVRYGAGKEYFGDKGLSSKLWEMQKGEIININYVHKKRIVNFREYILVYLYSYIKFFRRLTITTLR